MTVILYFYDINRNFKLNSNNCYAYKTFGPEDIKEEIACSYKKYDKT